MAKMPRSDAYLEKIGADDRPLTVDEAQELRRLQTEDIMAERYGAVRDDRSR
jgi:hypothetical protein